jgi:type I restriction enzyme S subunit
MNVLLSIKPKYVDEILSGAKKYEFRRVIFRKSVETIYIYCNSSVKRVFGSFTMGGIPEGTPEEIWNPCHQYGGITGAALFKYFKNASKAYAIKIRNSHRFDAPIDPSTVLPDFSPPQSFRYIPSWSPARE